MANRRMFSSRITESTRFIKMPATSQNLYFHLGMKADDDGIVEAYPIMCAVGSTEDDLRVLVGKEFVTILNEDLVSYLPDWKEHNNIRADRKVDSIYKDLLLKVFPDAALIKSKATYYSRTKTICQTNDGQVIDNSQTNDSIGKVRLGKDSLDKDINKKHKYGAYANVLLKDSELEKLNSDYGEQETQAAITYLDEYIEMKGTKYKSCYLAMRKWVFDAVKKQPMAKNEKAKEEEKGVDCYSTDYYKQFMG